MENSDNLLTLQEASRFASSLLGKNISNSNISYLIQYGLIAKQRNSESGVVLKSELEDYYRSNVMSKEKKWKIELGDDINWALSFDNLAEKVRTKHVHRLHPYKGKFIPQLVEYFLDSHTDEYKTQVYFEPGSIVLDPFCGSGTTLVQSNELGIHSIGVDISTFNAMISNVKVDKHDLNELLICINEISRSLINFIKGKKYLAFDSDLASKLSAFNNSFFSSPEYRYNIKQGKTNEKQYAQEKELAALDVFNTLLKEYNLTIQQESETPSFLDGWYTKPIRDEIDHIFSKIHELKNNDIKKVLAVILSRTMRSCRATTHQDLATLLEPVYTTYYCHKHYKICKPLFTLQYWWDRYSIDTMKRLKEFDNLRTQTAQHCFSGDSRTIDLETKIMAWNHKIGEKVIQKGIDGIFSSPPYVGLIDYHEQHAYAYDLFKFERNDEHEIGPLFKGQKKDAQDSYVNGISNVLNNCRKYLKKDFDIFLVANDKFKLYPKIAELSGMRIVHEFRRPVLNRTEKNKTPYSESIFHIKGL